MGGKWWRWWGMGLVAVALLGGLGCSDSKDAAPEQRKADLKVDAGLVSAMNGMGFRALGEAAKTDGTKNLFISPASLELALAMTYNGASGDTQKAMAQALGYGDMTLEQVNAANAQLLTLLQNPDTNVKLSIANGIWYRPDIQIKAAFLEKNRGTYTAKVADLNFANPDAAGTINRWVSDNTAGKIPTLVDADAIRDAYLVLVNALYFKGAWTDKFDMAQTADGPFTKLDGTKATLPMMHRTGKYRYAETDTAQIVELPYGEQYVGMVIVLPKASVKFSDFQASLTAENWANWTAALHEESEVTLTMPRFSAACEAKMKPILSALGMEVAFTDKADFGGMFTATPAQGTPAISEVLHKTTLDVNEEGTEASAATGVIIAPTAMPPQATLTVDRPFACVIRDNPTRAILFMGTIAEPK